MESFEATSREVHACLCFEADCTIGSFDALNATEEIARKAAVGAQLVKIGSDEVSDRCELRTVLSTYPPDQRLTFTLRRDGATGDTKVPAAPPATVAATEPTVRQPDTTPAEVNAYRPSLMEFGAVSGGSTIEAERTFRVALSSALNKVSKGRCIIGVCDAQFNPAEEIKILADELGVPAPVVVDFGVKLRSRVSKEQFARTFEEAMKAGRWLVIARSTKSMSLLSLLAALVEELHNNDLRDVDDAARIIISAEPHPHFPAALTHKSKTLRIKTSFSQSSIMYESIGNSVSALRIASDQESAPKANKKVRMSSAVSVVDIESRDITKTEKPSAPRAQVNVSGTVRLKAEFSALAHDKFFGICYAAADKSRLALASSLGNVYVVDDSGSSLVSFHVHEAAVWDVSFSSEYDFVTGGEDQSAVVWSRDDVEKDSLVCREVVKCANDVYAVRHTNSKLCVAVGGLMPKMTLLGLSTSKVQHVALPTSLQALSPLGDNCIVGGGGDGSVFVVDTTSSTVVSTASQHTKKCPCVTAYGTMVISGSFDCTIRSWDSRTSGQSSHTMKFQHYVTGVAADDNYLAACVGDNLYLWDVRNLSVVLGGQPQAWSGLSRAICIDADARTIVTASPDGVARFWSFATD